ncbi:MAG: nicotinate (nicotinamide) nucleotide adenylyltransferase [Deltaproteobacteria bacterium]|jgi:nicotinate-nucleotide adenylyltransferase|nr:nicotinate (nicotinamide) nucleotide adenylyltransferase [Deltaproteobacteria bacterium]
MTFSGALRLGLMGGTFNPVHLGHLRAAEELTEYLNLDRVVFMPSHKPPHKPGLNLASFDHRLTMLKLAVAGQPLFMVSDLESALPGPSYTVNTLRAVSEKLDANGELFFMVGFDSFQTLSKWYRHEELLKLASFSVFRRPGLGSELSSVGELLTKLLGPPLETQVDPTGRSGAFLFPNVKPIHYFADCLLEISSTDLRKRLDLGTSVRYLVPEKVREYIAVNALYHR